MENNIVESGAELASLHIDYQKLLDKNRDIKSLVGALIESDIQGATQKRISSRETKIQNWFGKQEDLPAEKVRDLRIRMMNFVDKLFAKVHLDEARELTPDEAHSLMAEFLDSEEFKIVFDARRKATKAMVFNSLTAENIREGVPEPDNHNGAIEVPQLGKKFCREGTGRGEPTLQEWKLHEVLDSEDYDKITDKIKIPSHYEVSLNEEKLMDLCREKPEVLEKIREAISIGEIKTPRFFVRDI